MIKHTIRIIILFIGLIIFSACTEPPNFSEAEKQKIPLRYPIVLVHGASMGGSVLRLGPFHFGEYFQYLPAYLNALGNRVEVPHLSTDSSIAERALLLANFLVQKFPGEKVNIIAHSLAGLDARFLATVLKSPQIASITTIATPHHGSPLANWAFQQAEEKRFWYWVLRIFGYDLRGRRFLTEIQTASMENHFNRKVIDREDIKYFSVRAWGEPYTWSLSPLLYIPDYFLRSEKHPMSMEKNDGLVPMSSQRWGKVIAELELDHLAQINHHTLRPWRGDASIALYRMILENLAREGL